MPSTVRPHVVGVRVSGEVLRMLTAMGDSRATVAKPPTVLYDLALAELARRRNSCRHPERRDGYCVHCGETSVPVPAE